MRDLEFQFKQMCDHRKGGSHSWRATLRRLLSIIAKDIELLGFRNLDIKSLKPKHVEALVKHWKEKGLSTGTIKNLMVAIRHWAEYVGKENVVKRANHEYGISNRVFVTNVSKAKQVNDDQLSLVTDRYSRMSLQLQQAFGLRREESMKLQPEWADLGDRLRLKESWTKGGRYREILITTGAQRVALDAAKDLVGKGSLIPAGMRYKDQLNRYKAQCAKAGINFVHGLRHHYVQERYEALTGWKAPACGGPVRQELSAQQKERDRDVRLLLSSEIGHHREQVTAIYLGR